MIILQWNGRLLIANGQEFKGFIKGLRYKPEMICIQETWLKPALDFVIKGYDIMRWSGGGCLLFVNQEKQ